jgi:UDP-glucose 4-epimerase
MMLPEINSHFNGKRVLITGGLGFIGSNLAQRLITAGAHITIADSLIPEYGGNPYNIAGLENQVSISYTDLRDENSIRHLVHEQDFIIHLAAQVSHIYSMHNPSSDLDINCHGTIVLLEACRKVNPRVKIVFTGTRQVYGRPKYLPVDENHPLDPMDFNGANKLAADLYHTLCYRVYGLHTVCLRLTNVYGPRMRVKDAHKNFIGWWIHNLIDRQPIQIYGDGTQVRDFNFIDDVLNAILLAAIHPKTDGEIYNLGHPETISLLDLAKRMIALAGEGSYQFIRFPPERLRIEIGDYQGNFSKIHTLLGWQPTTTFEEGMRQTLAYYRKNKSKYW